MLKILTMIADKSGNNIDLFSHINPKYIDTIQSVTINGLICKFSYNTRTKSLYLMTNVFEKGDRLIIAYYPNISEIRNDQLVKLGI